ncbi:Smad nuclear-interacting protein 1 [Cichlidogyrus casuarinus]|uniref:Smad nuclear-interacting protein 1 n=1 Tax=Cichlidogyrus casuarinus TaxID=1844966 RepID=A0ABD2QL86_9PLAT
MNRSRSPISKSRHRSRSPKSGRTEKRRTNDNRDDNRKRNRRLDKPEFLEKPESHSRLAAPQILDDQDEEPDVSDSSTKEDDSRKQLTSRVDVTSVNFGLSGKLTAETNTFKGVVIKYNEPSDARKPTEYWRLYPFKGKEALPILHIHRQSGFLIGRDRNIADIPMDHPSISKQHAVLQFRHVKGLTRLYLIDLESANGTFLNNNRIESKRYYELKEQDMIKFGFSSRDYVVMIDENAGNTKTGNE